MKSELKMRNKLLAIVTVLSSLALSSRADSIPSMFSRQVEWRIGAEVSPSWVPATNTFLRGDNNRGERMTASVGGDIRADFSFSPATREGMLYKGVRQGLGIGVSSYFPSGLLGTPVSAYVYQGAPIVRLGNRLWLGYEWQFGAAFGWKHYDKETDGKNIAIGTPVTAHIGVAFKLNYRLTERWEMSFGIVGRHFSNGNTSWPNNGVNTLGASVGIAYVINPEEYPVVTAETLAKEADRHKWMFDLMAYGAWRKKVVTVGTPAQPQLCPGKFGVAGMQFAPLYTLNRRFAAGPALDLQWDESGGIQPYWVEGSYEDNIKFRRPPFGKQISVGISAHAELTMPIFSVNVGLGYDVVNPQGEKAFYQSLTLKTFLTKRIYLNTGYRLGNFKDPQNLMLGIGVRL